MKIQTCRRWFLIAGMFFCLCTSAFAYSGGSGEPNDPYQIADVNDLLALSADVNDYNKCFILTSNINLNGLTLNTAIIAPDTNSDDGFQGVGFTGVFDGNGHIITNFNIDGGSNWYLGFFGEIDSNGTVKNLGLQNVSITGGNNSGALGGLAGWSEGNISNCYSTGNITGGNDSEALGGLVGLNRGNISNCYSTGNITGGNNSEVLGGLVGGSGLDGNINNCYSTGKITGGNNSGDLGGLVGWSVNSNISNCYSTGNITDGNNSDSLGGLVGQNLGIISNCYSTGNITDGNNSYFSGGLVGSQCWILREVIHSGRVVSSFWDVNTSGLTDGVGDENPDPNGVTGKTTDQMQTLSTFTNAGWDFSYKDGNEAIWFMPVDDYPILVWQISPADIYSDGKNNFMDFATFAEYWMRKDCRIYNDYCDFADLNFDGKVDYEDLLELMSYWLQEGIYN